MLFSDCRISHNTYLQLNLFISLGTPSTDLKQVIELAYCKDNGRFVTLFIISCRIRLYIIINSTAGEPGKLIRERYRTASQVVQNQVRSSTTFTVNICMSGIMQLNSAVWRCHASLSICMSWVVKLNSAFW